MCQCATFFILFSFFKIMFSSLCVFSESWRTTWVAMSQREMLQCYCRPCWPGTLASSGRKVRRCIPVAHYGMKTYMRKDVRRVDIRKRILFFCVCVWTDVMQQAMVPPYKITQNSMHSPAQSANFQPAAISPNPPRWAKTELKIESPVFNLYASFVSQYYLVSWICYMCVFIVL